MASNALEVIFSRSREKCSIVFGEGLLAELKPDFFSGASSLAVVTDDNVGEIYSQNLMENLSEIAKSHLITFRHGERSKNLATVEKITKTMSELGLDRRSMILALGGGVVGDIAGFVASIYKRGISYFQVPTTLLAQVDSSIGGKSGVDTNWGKNQLGTFYQPRAVFIDTETLDSLPYREMINGLGEMIKSGIIADRTLFREIEMMEEYSTVKLKPLIQATCKIKARVVEADERESNLRFVLNYGHTIGHAIESSSGYRLSHGKSVILGMICEGWIARRLGIFDAGDYDRQCELLQRIQRQFRIGGEFDPSEILSFSMLDKKNVGGVLNMSLPEKIGRMHSIEGKFATPIPKKMVLESLQNLRNDLN